MLANYFIVGIRNLMREKILALINVVGLAIGLACTLLLALYIHHEWSYDRFHEKNDRLFRVVLQVMFPDHDPLEFAVLPEDFAERLKASGVQVASTTRVVATPVIVSAGGHASEKDCVLVDPDFLRMFSFPLVAGDVNSALNGPDRVLITTTAARDLFGDSFESYGELLGQNVTIETGGKRLQYIVSGILEAVPATSSLKFEAVLSFENHPSYGKRSMTYHDLRLFASTYIETDTSLREKDVKQHLEDALASLVPHYLALGRLPEIRFRIQAITAQRHETEVQWNHVVTADKNTTQLMMWVAVVVLLISCINYTTLSVSRSTTRVTEVGVRKAFGARRWHLIQQFCCEGVATACVAFVLSVVLVQLLLPAFNTLSFKRLALSDLDAGLFSAASLLLVGMVGVVAGGYPAFVLSRSQTNVVLRGGTYIPGRAHPTRWLMMVQFAISTILFVWTLVIIQQLRYVEEKDLGFTREPVMLINLQQRAAGIEERGPRMKVAVQAISGVKSASLFREAYTVTGVKNPTRQTEAMVYFSSVDADYIETMGIKLLQGRGFRSPGGPGVLVNETFVKEVDLNVGEVLPRRDNPTIGAVVRDFHFESLHTKIMPLVIYVGQGRLVSGAFGFLAVRLSEAEMAQTVRAIKATWQERAGTIPFEFSLLEDSLGQHYQRDVRWAKIVAWAGGFTILIALMGLLGQSSLTVIRMTKQIGVRKILGASTRDIVTLLLTKVVKPVLAVNLVTWPIAWYVSRVWLERFVYRIVPGPELFVAVGLGVLMITGATVGYLGLRAAKEDPLKELRYE